MNLKKAIEIKEKYQYILQDASFPELIEADDISIEALIHIKDFRLTVDGKPIYQLPGETE